MRSQRDEFGFRFVDLFNLRNIVLDTHEIYDVIFVVQDRRDMNLSLI